MKKRSLRQHMVCLLPMSAGLVMAQLGVALFLCAGLGADPFNLLIQGLSGRTAQGYSLIYLLLGTLTALALFAASRSIRPGTLVCAVLGGPLAETFTRLLSRLIDGEAYMPVRLLASAAACLLFAFGMAFMRCSDAGMVPDALLPDALSVRFHISRGYAGAFLYILFAAAGILAGGTFGIGTLLAIFAANTLAGYFMPVCQLLVDRVLQSIG